MRALVRQAQRVQRTHVSVFGVFGTIGFAPGGVDVVAHDGLGQRGGRLRVFLERCAAAAEALGVHGIAGLQPRTQRREVALLRGLDTALQQRPGLVPDDSVRRTHGAGHPRRLRTGCRPSASHRRCNTGVRCCQRCCGSLLDKGR